MQESLAPSPSHHPLFVLLNRARCGLLRGGGGELRPLQILHHHLQLDPPGGTQGTQDEEKGRGGVEDTK